MTILAVSTGWINYDGFNVNVTVRDSAPLGVIIPLTELTMLTVRTLVFCAKNIQAGNRQINFEKHPALQNSPAANLECPPHELEPYVTVFCDVIGKQSLTLHSHTYAQDALDVFWARYDALEKLGVFGSNEQSSTPTQENSGNSPSSAASGQLPDGVIIGKMNPTSTKVYYQHDQLVALPINRWKLTFRDGYIYEAWGTNGNGQYPAHKIYKTKKGSDENSDSYIAIKPFLEGLALTLEQSEAQGNWWLIGKINHAGEKEFYNPVEVRSR